MASRTLGAVSSSVSRPARTYSVSTLIFSALASAWRISADGRRRPRSICDKYGFDTPASSASRRTDMLATSRCDLMKAPSSATRSLSSWRISSGDGMLTGAPRRLAPSSLRRPSPRTSEPTDRNDGSLARRLARSRFDVPRRLLLAIPPHELLAEVVELGEQLMALVGDLALERVEGRRQLGDRGVLEIGEAP